LPRSRDRDSTANRKNQTKQRKVSGREVVRKITTRSQEWRITQTNLSSLQQRLKISRKWFKSLGLRDQTETGQKTGGATRKRAPWGNHQKRGGFGGRRAKVVERVKVEVRKNVGRQNTRPVKSEMQGVNLSLEMTTAELPQAGVYQGKVLSNNQVLPMQGAGNQGGESHNRGPTAHKKRTGR